MTDADGKTWVGPPVSQTYADTRVDWKTLKGKLVTFTGTRAATRSASGR